MDYGTIQRAYEVQCPVCGRAERVRTDTKRAARDHLHEIGWSSTRDLSADDSRHYVCGEHRVSGENKVYFEQSINSERGRYRVPGDWLDHSVEERRAYRTEVMAGDARMNPHGPFGDSGPWDFLADE